MEFVELAARTSFSFLRGASRPQEMVDRAKELGLSSIGLCDRDGLYGIARAHARAEEIGQALHFGAELPLALSEVELRSGHAGAREARSEAAWRKLLRSAKPNEARKRKLLEDGFPTILLLVKNHVGYQNLCWLLTQAHAGLPKGECLLELAALEGHTGGLVALVPTLLRNHRHARASDFELDAFSDAMISRLCDLFDGSIHSLCYRRLSRADALRTRLAKSRQARWGLSVAASAWPAYHDASRKRLHDVLCCIRLGTSLDEARTKLSENGQAYLRNAEQMAWLFRDQPDWVAQSAQIADTLRFHIRELSYHFPCETRLGRSPDEELEHVCREGAAWRYPDGVPPKVQHQLDEELALIQRMKVAPYFLSTLEVVNIARERGILCQGRGSAANSAVCYVLGITAVNPEHSNLLFERFMSEERKEPPDIDVDFEHERREEVIQELYRRYGRDRAAMVSEVICYRRRSALREVSKVFGFSADQSDRLVNAFSHWDRDEEGFGKIRLRAAGIDLEAEKVKTALEMARTLVGFPRHLSIHVGGFVLSSRPLFEVSPVEPARMIDRSVVPWDKDDLDVLGFFKIDVLALGMLTAVRKALRLCWDCGAFQDAAAPDLTSGVGEPHFDPLRVITQIPDEDPAVYALTARADTVGVFQIESRAQMSMLPRLVPKNFYDLVIEVAIVRPGPIQGGMVHPYLRRRNGEEAPTCHPLLQPILERTLGVPLFQEQVMQIAITGAGYSGGEADQLRRDMAAWKKTGRLERHRARLLSGFEQRGIDRSFGEALFEQIKGFGEYGFPESHAASFALLVYKSAWLKAHYPAHFLCALLNSQPMGFYSPASLVRDAREHGVEVRPVCVCASDWDCTLELVETGRQSQADARLPRTRAPGSARAVRLGLSRVKGLSRRGADLVVERRDALRGMGGWAANLDEFAKQVPLSKVDFEALAEAGAFAALETERRQVLWSAKAPRQLALFQHVKAREQRPALPALSALEQLTLDYSRLRLSIDDHPLRHLRAGLRRRGVRTARELLRAPAGARVAVAGLVTARQRPGTASGVVFVTLEDETAIANLIFYSRVFDTHRFAAHCPLLLVRGKVERQDPNARAVNPSDPRQADGIASIVHLIVEHAEELTLATELRHTSRDFH